MAGFVSTQPEDQPKNICGPNVKSFRKKLGMAQVELAEALNVDFGYTLEQSDVSEIERQDRGVKDHELMALATVLQTSPNHLLNYKGTEG